MRFNYIEYWDDNYSNGGTSGRGSYGELADFKAEVVNELVERNGVRTVIEFGCGDGNQLSLMKYPEYLGLDVAASAVQLCTERFKDDPGKRFMQYDPRTFADGKLSKFDMVVCLDVLYHITDDEDFEATLRHIFDSSSDLVVLYTRLTTGKEAHVVDTIKDRDIFGHLRKFPDFSIEAIVPQRYRDQSSSDFIIMRKTT
ncbi:MULTISPECIES: class I SAM-dependent methyltransferase [Paenibacillus]|uniref:class I SAM-dependent methyltransferase n=1 Tax=Paenibacillus TaxID=44249 RepID=UPI001FD0C8D5|nr:class I SAM-dependent methyltransferase [Paenibacillus campinasensis]